MRHALPPTVLALGLAAALLPGPSRAADWGGPTGAWTQPRTTSAYTPRQLSGITAGRASLARMQLSRPGLARPSPARQQPSRQPSGRPGPPPKIQADRGARAMFMPH